LAEQLAALKLVAVAEQYAALSPSTRNRTAILSPLSKALTGITID